MVELLAPAGNYEKMVTAFKYGADAVYMAGKKFGLRAFAGNFDNEELEQAVNYAHNLGKKVYITLNILAHEGDFVDLKDYVQYLEKINVDAVLVSDIGVMDFIRQYAPKILGFIYFLFSKFLLSSMQIKPLSFVFLSIICFFSLYSRL